MFLSRVSQKCFCVLSTSHQKANDDKFVPLCLIKFYHLIKVVFARFLSHKVTILFPFLKRYFETVNILFLITLLPTILVSVDDSWLKKFYCGILKMVIFHFHLLCTCINWNSTLKKSFLLYSIYSLLNLFMSVCTHGFLFYSIDYNPLLSLFMLFKFAHYP